MQLSRIKYIDQLRGLAILLVVIGHLYEHSFGGNSQVIFNLYLPYHMPLFMFLSGIFALKKRSSFWQYSKHKFMRLIIPFLTVGVICVLSKGLSPFVLFTGEANEGYWFLPTLFYCSIICYIINNISISIQKCQQFKIDILLYLIPYILLCLMYRFSFFHQLNSTIGTLYILYNYPFFVLGIFFGKYERLQELLKKESAFCLSLILYVLYLVYKQDIPCNFKFVGVCGIIILICLFNKYSEYIDRRFSFSYIGKHTLEIYLFHYFFLPSFPDCFEFFDFASSSFIPNNGNLVVIIPLLFLLALVIIYLCLLCGIIFRNNKLLKKIILGENEK